MASNEPKKADIDDDILLDQVAEKLGTKAYRVGILLGLSPAELDSLHFDYKDRGLVVLNTAMLVKWRNQGDRTTLELAQALMKVGMGRIAKELDPSVEQNPGPSCINRGSRDLSYEEFHDISVAVSSSWERLAIHLEVSSDSTESIRSITRDPVECCFRMLSAWYDTGSSSRDKLVTVLEEIGKDGDANRAQATDTIAMAVDKMVQFFTKQCYAFPGAN